MLDSVFDADSIVFDADCIVSTLALLLGIDHRTSNVKRRESTKQNKKQKHENKQKEGQQESVLQASPLHNSHAEVCEPPQMCERCSHRLR